MHDETEKITKVHLPVPAIGLAICTGILLVFGMVMLLLCFINRSEKNTMHTYVLGEAAQSGYIGVKITYDKEPVDITLYDPKGTKYQQHSSGIYYDHDQKNKTILLMTDSNMLGVWSAEFNTKSNKKITYSLAEMPSETLYITKPVITMKENGQYYLNFTAALADSKETTANCNLSLTKSSFSYGFAPMDITLNQKTDILLEFPDHAFTDSDYKLKINLITESGKIANSEIKVHLNKRPDKPKETDSETDTSE